MSVGQHRIFHQGIRDFLVSIGVEPTKENMTETKEMFKRHLGVRSVAALTDVEYSDTIFKTFAIMAAEWGVEVPLHESEKSMRELLNEIKHE